MTEEVNAVETAQDEAPQLSLQDIATMVQIIDVCSKRDGFEGPELEAVGSLRNRVVAFLKKILNYRFWISKFLLLFRR